MGKSSFRKGRGAEFEIAALYTDKGINAGVNGIYEPLDIHIEMDGMREDFEVKRKRDMLAFAYKAIDNDAKGVHCRADRRPWLTIIPTADYIDLKIRAGAVVVSAADIAEPIE